MAGQRNAKTFRLHGRRKGKNVGSACNMKRRASPVQQKDQVIFEIGGPFLHFFPFFFGRGFRTCWRSNDLELSRLGIPAHMHRIIYDDCVHAVCMYAKGREGRGKGKEGRKQAREKEEKRKEAKEDGEEGGRCERARSVTMIRREERRKEGRKGGGS